MYHHENKHKPEITKRLSEFGGLHSPKDVAKSIVNNVRSKEFHIVYGLDGWMLTRLNIGMSPSRSKLNVFIDFFTIPFLRLISYFYYRKFIKMVKD